MEYNHLVLDWSIENLNSWNRKFHGKGITCPLVDNRYLSEENAVEFYPLGDNGKGEHLEVCIFGSLSSDCELSLIDSVESVFLTQQIKGNGLIKVIQGPKFKEVLDRINNNEATHKDILTLRFKRKSPFDSVRQVRSVIDVFEEYLNLNYEYFRNNDSTFQWNHISSVHFPIGDGYDELVKILFKRKSDGEGVYFKFLKSVKTTTYLLKVLISLLDSDGIVAEYKDEHVFQKTELFFRSVPLKKGNGKESCVQIRFKFILEKLKTYTHMLIWPVGDDSKASITNFPVQNSSKSVTSSPSVEALTKDLLCLNKEKHFSDFQIRCENVSFATHKIILSARSPVFQCLLSSGMKEAASGSMDIDDLDPPTLARFINFLYSGTTCNLQWESALKLYYAADKYFVPTVKAECVSVLCSSVSVSNVCEILSLADNHQDTVLMSKTHDFILENYDEVLGSNEWEIFMKTDSDLLLKTVTFLGKHKYVGKIDSQLEIYM